MYSPSSKWVQHALVGHREGIYRDVQGVGGEGAVLPTPAVAGSAPFTANRAHDCAMRRIIWCVTAAIFTTLIFGSVYLALQQIGRHGANMAPTAAAAAQLQQMGSDPTTGPRLELTPDSGLFVIVYDEANAPVSTTVTLHGSTPAVPDGVLNSARSLGTDTVTWQPEPGLRMAIVAKDAAGKVVVAGQSLTPFERAPTCTLSRGPSPHWMQRQRPRFALSSRKRSPDTDPCPGVGACRFEGEQQLADAREIPPSAEQRETGRVS
jgi:hypothetical protein